jgi:peptidoglycan/LPS O-acetylase OafA/YrhL
MREGFAMAARLLESLERPTEPGDLTDQDCRKTYRYVRIGVIGAVVVLGVSIAIEWSKVDFDCYQNSVSAYYYTPVRAIFVGTMIVVGFALIVYKGRSPWEDTCLNFAGMLAPVVAIAPTTDVGTCWSVRPIPLPVRDNGTVARWVHVNIDNNFSTLLIAGGLGLLLAFVLVLAVNWKSPTPVIERLMAPVKKVEPETWISLVITGLALLAGWWLIENWGGFYTQAHGWAAVIFFFFLGLAIVINARAHWEKQRKLFWVYAGIAALMLAGFLVIPPLRVGGAHTVFWLEAWEILMFVTYWIFQTVENWGEDVQPKEVEVASG